MTPNFVNVSIPSNLAKAINEYIKDNPHLDLRSRVQVVNFSLRRLFCEAKQNEVKHKITTFTQ